MTRKEAIKRLKEARFTVQPYQYINEALDTAIKALEQEPCEDCISRQAVIDILDDMTKDYAKSNDFEKVNGVAWVKVQKLPSVNSQKIGHWIVEVGDRETGYGGCTMCSECSGEGDTEMDYCPHCGARMGGAE